MKTVFNFAVWLAVLLLVAVVPAFGIYDGGSGTASDPWRIYDAADLQAICSNNSHWDDYFRLTADISVSGTTITPIGTVDNKFIGSFDGNGYSITGLSISGSSANCGLFAYIGAGGKVQNLTVSGSISSTSQNCGLIAGQNFGTIGNCHVSGTVTGQSKIGGIVGTNNSGATIVDCQASVTITGNGASSNTGGGIVGSNLGNVKTSQSSGTISVSTNNAGGIVGVNGATGLIENCLSKANCYAANTNSGGISGYNASGGKVRYCIALGIPTVNTSSSSTKYLGGLVGDNYGGTIEYCLWDQTISSLAAAFGRNTGTATPFRGATTSELKSPTYITSLNWDFTGVWLFNSGSYPALNNVPDISLTYTTSMTAATNQDIILNVTMTNSSYNSGNSQVEMVVFVGYTAAEIAELSTPTFDFEELRFAIPAAQSSQNYQLNLSDNLYFPFNAGTYFVMVTANYSKAIAENDYTNNSGPIMTLKVFDPTVGEPDNTISQLNPTNFASTTTSLSKTASLSPVDGSAYDTDWAGLIVDVVSDISVTVTNQESSNIVLELYDPTGTTLITSSSGTGSASINTRLEATNGTGTYYYVKVYPSNHQSVMSYTLNASVTKVKPELVPAFVDPLVVYYRLGDAGPSLNCSVTNTSVVSAAEFTCILVSSPTTTFTKPYNQVNQFTISLAAGATRTNNFTIPVPTVTGNTYYAFIVDSGETIAETDETNNITSTPLRLYCYADDNYEQNNDNTIATTNGLTSGTTQIHNLVPASDIDYSYFDLTESSQITITVTSAKTLAVSLVEIVDGQETTVSIGNPTVTGNTSVWNKTQTISSVRRFYLRIEETATGLEVPDYSVNVKIKPNAPDLEVVLTDKYLYKAAGETVAINIKAINSGTVAADSIVVDLYAIALTATPNWSTATKYGTTTISSISAAANKTGTISITAPVAGLYYMQARIFTTGEVVERDITNNNSLARILAVDTAYTYNGGSGTETDPWQIATALQLDTISEISDHLDDFFVLTADIDLTPLKGDYSSIGKTAGTPFTGVFDGAEHTISNYQFDGSGSITGIFGYTSFATTGSADYEISNINLTGVSVNVSSSTLPAGGLIGSNGCWVNNCTVSGSVTAVTYAGLMAGKNSSGSGSITPRISNCTVSGTVKASGDYAGGFVGWNDGYLTSCRVMDGSSVVAGNYAGGLVGKNSNMLAFCYSLAEVDSTTDYSGGFVASNSGIISSCYSTGATGSIGSHKNGFCASNSGTIASCFWNETTSGQEDTAANTGFVGLSESDFRDKDIYLAAGWEFGAGKPWLMLDEQMWPQLTSLFAFSGGDGTASAPYLVINEIDLMLVSELPGNHYKLQRDFDLADWYIQSSLFGNYQNNIPFTGVFDGNGYKLSNITISRADSGAGLFGYISSDADNEIAAGVRNLILENVQVKTAADSNIAGCLAGYVYDGFIENCAVRNGSVLCSMYGGGLVGFGESCQIKNSCFVGQIDTALFGGGLAGGLRNSGVSGCYSAAEVLAYDYADGLAGYQRYSLFSKSYWNGTLCPEGTGGVALTTDQMTNGRYWYDNTTLDLVRETAHGNADLWQVADNYYPWLAIETPEIKGDLNNDLLVNLLDWGILANNWQKAGDWASDINGDGTTDITDLGIMADDWNSSIY